MYHHTIRFHSIRGFGQFEHEMGSWWKELVTFQDGQLEPDDYYLALYRSETPVDKEHQIDVQGAPWIIKATFNLSDDDTPSTQEEKEEEEDERIPLDSQLGKDAATLLVHYFPGSTVTRVESKYHRGVFVGDYSIELMCEVSHPVLMGAVLGFGNENVPGRPGTWKELCACQIDLYVKQFTLVAPNNSTGPTYGLPGMYQEELKTWCDSHGDGGYSSLYGHIETPDMFIITTELFSHSHEEVEQAAKLLAVQAKAKIEQEWQEVAESPSSDDPFSD